MKKDAMHPFCFAQSYAEHMPSFLPSLCVDHEVVANEKISRESIQSKSLNNANTFDVTFFDLVCFSTKFLQIVYSKE